MRCSIYLLSLWTLVSWPQGVYANNAVDSVDPVVKSGHSEESAEEGSAEFDASKVILHHIADAHDWHLYDHRDEAGHVHPVSIPLPVILWCGGQWHFMMSSAFEHGHAQPQSGSLTFRLDEHGHIQEASGLPVMDLSITKNVASMLLSIVLLLIIFISAARSYARSSNRMPSGLARFLEPIILFIRDDIARPNIGEKRYAQYMPYLLTAFFFIWINNLLGLLPTGANLTGNIAVSMVLAVFTLLITNFSGNKHYWSHIFLPHVPKWLYPIMIPVEVVGIFSKPIALTIRLFANITAGHIIILSLISLIFIFKTLAMAPVSIAFVLFMECLEILVAALQAYVFTLLSALFIGLATAEPEHGAHDAH
ncbi:MAG: F0F1 ATP synthase subunit A [Sphingomonadales bacterium]|nr:F0F1 ATP synthase subunit A [Sphingomonadales bacterium]